MKSFTRTVAIAVTATAPLVAAPVFAATAYSGSQPAVAGASQRESAQRSSIRAPSTTPVIHDRWKHWAQGGPTATASQAGDHPGVRTAGNSPSARPFDRWIHWGQSGTQHTGEALAVRHDGASSGAAVNARQPRRQFDRWRHWARQQAD